MALNNSYDPYDPSSPYRTNSYNTGMYGNSGSTTSTSQSNAYNQSYGTNSNPYGSSATSSPYDAFANAAGSWGPRSNYGSYGNYDTQSPYGNGDWTLQNVGAYPMAGGNIQSPSYNYGGPSRPGVNASIGPVQPNPTITGPHRAVGSTQPPPYVIGDGPAPINQGPQRPGMTGSIGPTMPRDDKSSFYNSDGTFNTLGYYQQWLPHMTQDQLNQYWTEGKQGQSQGQNISDWWNSRFNQDGTAKQGYGANGSTPSSSNPGNMAGQYVPNQLPPTSQQQWAPGTYKYVPGYGWTASQQEYDQAQQQVAQQSQSSAPQTGSPGTLLTNGSADPITPSPTLNPPGYTPSGVAPPPPTQFPTSPFAGGAPESPGTPGSPTTGEPGSSNDLVSYLHSYLAPQFAQEQSDLNRQALATGAQLGDLNSGGFATSLDKAQSRLSADEGSRMSDYLTQASEAAKNRQLQAYQIDSSNAIAQMNNETAQYGIRTNDDLQRYLNSQNNALAKYGIDKNDVLQRYIAIQQAHGQASAANSAFNAAALQAATQQAIAAMNNQTAQQNSQNQYNLGVLGINGENYRADQGNLLSYLNLLLGANPQPPVPQIPGVVGYGG